MADDQSNKRHKITSGVSGDSTCDYESENHDLRSENARLRQQLLSADKEVVRLRQRLGDFEGCHDVLPVVKQTPTVDLSRLDKGLVTHILSFLGTYLELRNLALTCKSFGWHQPGSWQDLPFAEEVARRVVRSERNGIEGTRITLSQYARGRTTWLSILRESEEPLKFDTLFGRGIRHANEDKTSVRCGINAGMCTAVASNFVMISGVHYAEFHIAGGTAFIGIVRPMPTLDPARYANDDLFFFDSSLFNYFLAARTEEWGTGNVHTCVYSTHIGGTICSNWDDGNEERRMVNWDGMEGCQSGNTVGMLLNLDEGTLTAYKNNRRLGVMKDGLSGSYCWYTSVWGATSAVEIRKCEAPDA